MQFCDSPATVHLTDIVNKKKRELHLCEECAARAEPVPDPPGPQIDLTALMNLLDDAASSRSDAATIRAG